jgi:hypothetical protein
MPDRDGTLNTNPEHTLAAALRALPDTAPQPDLWPDLAHALGRKRRTRVRRYLIPVALAAGLALALLLPSTTLRQPAPVDTPVIASSGTTTSSPAQPAAAARDEIVDLHQRSQALERWIAAVSARAPQDSRDLMAVVEVEDLIGLIDLQLGAARDGADALPLWRQRVALLEDLAAIRVGAFTIAANDNLFDGTNAPFNRIN